MSERGVTVYFSIRIYQAWVFQMYKRSGYVLEKCRRRQKIKGFYFFFLLFSLVVAICKFQLNLKELFRLIDRQVKGQ